MASPDHYLAGASLPLFEPASIRLLRLIKGVFSPPGKSLQMGRRKMQVVHHCIVEISQNQPISRDF
jgi:hypothetical protein